MIIGAKAHEGKTRMLIKLANEKSEKYEVYFYNIEESKETLNEMGLNTSIKVLSDSFETLYNFLETIEIKPHKPRYYIIDNLGLVIKDDVEDVIPILSKLQNISLSYDIGSRARH